MACQSDAKRNLQQSDQVLMRKARLDCQIEPLPGLPEVVYDKHKAKRGIYEIAV